MNTIAPARSSAGLARWAALGGILYVVLFIVGTILMFSGEPDSDASPATYAGKRRMDRSTWSSTAIAGAAPGSICGQQMAR